MDDPLADSLLIIGGILVAIRWWYVAKSNTSKKYILKLGISILIIGISVIFKEIFHAGFFSLIGIVAIFSSIYFLIRALLSDNSVNNASLPE